MERPVRVSNVVIIGAGLAGPTLALCLKKQHNISCTIYESRPSADERGTGISLAPNALRVMQHVGVFDELRARGHNYDEIAVSNDSGQQLARFLHGSEKFYNFPALRISRRRVQQVLLDEVKAQGIQIHYGMRLAKVEEETDSVVKLQFRNGQTVEADFVIGTDGVHSVVRDHVVPGTEPYYSGFMGITGKLPRDKLHESSTKYHLPNMFFGKSGFLAAMPSNYPGTEIGFFSTMTFPARSRKEWDDLANKRDELKEILIHRFGKEWLELVQGICKEVSIETLDLWPFFIVPTLSNWTSPTGRTIIIGDAAHAITPQGGQGAAVAFEDAETLAYTMSRLAFPDDRLRMLATWEQHRKERVEAVKGFTNRNSSLRSPGQSPWKQTIKEWIVWIMFQYLGPKAGVQWLLEYNAENMVGLLAN